MAKGNVILGDYTSTQFQTVVLPKIGSGAGTITQDYAIDATDSPMGYHDAAFDAQGRPLFSGNYDQQDQQAGAPGLKLDGTPRKFYESSLPDGQFRALLDNDWNPSIGGMRGNVHAALFTNHLLAGYDPHAEYFYLFGSVVARDDAFMFRRSLWIDHDVRLTTGGGGATTNTVGLPVSVKRPRLTTWKECPPEGCL